MQWHLLLIWLGQCCFMDCQLYQYHYIKEAKTWTEAQQHCREKHTDLATVISMKDMKKLINISAGKKSEAWIGLYDQTHAERAWHWSLPGVEFNDSETNWGPTEPNDLKPGGQKCAIVWRGENLSFKWGDLSCNEHQQFICYSENDSSHKYLLINQAKNWLEAQSYCRENHTDLISGTKQLLDAEVNKGLNLTTANSRYIFIGLFSDTWRWSDGSSFSFRHWDLRFDNQIINSGQCAVTVFDDGGRWKNENCAEKKPFICYDDKAILIKENLNWSKALHHCRTHHYDLVTITNMDDQRWIQEKVKNASTDYAWMGLRFNCTLNFWFWVCPGMTTFNISDGSTDDCNISGCMDVRGQHRWLNKNATEEFNFICAKV